MANKTEQNGTVFEVFKHLKPTNYAKKRHFCKYLEQNLSN